MSSLKTRIAKSLHRKAKRHLLRANPAAMPARFSSLRRFFPDGPNTLAFDASTSLFHLSEGPISLEVARPSRLKYQLDGMALRRAALLAEYLIPEGLIRPGDHILDCGANIGEFSLALRQEGATATAFEPDPVELAALRRNAAQAGDITVHDIALWHSDAELEFFDANDTGDSSLFDPGRSVGSYTVTARRLDTLRSEGAIPGSIRLLKLEAEGAEPEVIAGAPETLSHTDYITVDMGPERGLEKANTVAETVCALAALDFELIRFSTKRIVGLFQAKRLGGGSI